MVEMPLHTLGHGAETLGNSNEIARIKLVSIKRKWTTRSYRDYLALQFARGNAIKRLKAHVSTQLKYPATKMRRDGNVRQ